MYKLGDKVKFSNVLIKTNDYIDFNEQLTTKQSEELEKTGAVTLDVLKTNIISEKTGVIAGVRYLKNKRIIKQCTDENGCYYGNNNNCEMIKVYLIASSINFFYKVLEENLVKL